MNIVMIGMPGCGKSTVGVLLAKALQYDFTDCDLLIQKRCGMSLQELINQRGLRAFLEEEERTLCSVQTDGAVLATGGSAVYSEAAMRHLKQDAVTLYLSLPLGEIERRLTNIKTRGVAITKGQTIADIYNERLPLYERYADITLNTYGLTIEETVEKACETITERLGRKA